MSIYFNYLIWYIIYYFSPIVVKFWTIYDSLRSLFFTTSEKSVKLEKLNSDVNQWEDIDKRAGRQDKIEDLKKEEADIQRILEDYKNLSIAELWTRELDEFIKE